MSNAKERNNVFTGSRSAGEEGEMKRVEQSWDNEGGHMSATTKADRSRADEVVAGISNAARRPRKPTGLTPLRGKKSRLDRNSA